MVLATSRETQDKELTLFQDQARLPGGAAGIEKSGPPLGQSACTIRVLELLDLKHTPPPPTPPIGLGGGLLPAPKPPSALTLSPGSSGSAPRSAAEAPSMPPTGRVSCPSSPVPDICSVYFLGYCVGPFFLGFIPLDPCSRPCLLPDFLALTLAHAWGAYSNTCIS